MSPRARDFLALRLVAGSVFEMTLVLRVLRGETTEGDIMMGGDLTRSETSSEAGESVAKTGEGALFTVLVVRSVASLTPESLVSSMTSSGSGGAGGRTSVCAVRTSSSVALLRAGGLE